MTDKPLPPYSADARSMGYGFKLDLFRIQASDTWALAGERFRPYLLMLWAVSWTEIPCGSLPADPAVLAAKIGMDRESFVEAAPVLMRGWIEHSDGRLYHPVVTHQVIEMIDKRTDWRSRKKAKRERNLSNETPDGIQEESDGCLTGFTYTKDKDKSLSKEDHPTDDLVLTPSGESPDDDPRGYRIPPCPVKVLVDDFNTLAPLLPRCEIISKAREDRIRARWREICSKDKLSSPDAREVFHAVFNNANASRFLSGRVPPKDGRRLFKADIDWLMTPTYFTRVLEGRYE